MLIGLLLALCACGKPLPCSGHFVEGKWTVECHGSSK